MYIGSYTHNIDDKNRLSIPKKWHKEIGSTIVLTAGLDGSLFLYDIKGWEKITTNINNLSFLDKDSRNFARFILANAFEIDIDSHGRILIPENLKIFGKLQSSATLVGVGDRVEIWDNDIYKYQILSVNTNAEDLANKIYQMNK